MKKKLLVLLCLVAIAALVFSSCDIIVINGSQQGGSNTPGNTDNSGNNTGNNNEGNDGTDNSGGGSTDDGNDDNTDDTDDCEHTFSESWTTNKQSHWHAATCDHSSEKGDLGNHSDVNEDGRCDVCNYYVSHTHTYADEWSYDEVGHWHAATCTHNNVQGSYAEHVDANANGECDDCGAEVKVEIDVNSPEAIINQIISAKGGVATSNVREQAEFISLGDDGTATKDTVGVFKFGASSMYCNVVTESYQSYVKLPDGSYGPVTATSSYEKWQEYMSSDTVFGVFSNDGGELELDGTATIDTIEGYLFSVSTLASAHGAENILLELYKLSSDETAGNYVWQYDETTGVYSFGYDYLQINRDVAAGEDPNVNYYVVGVAFAHNENYVLTDLAIQCQCYSNSLEDERDNDYTYDDTTGTITMKPEGEYAADTYTFVVTQVVGDRTYVNENPRNKFLPETFELYTDESFTTVAGETLTISTNTLARFYLGAFLPEGTSISFSPEALTACISDGTNVYDSTIIGVLNDTVYLSHNPIDENVTLRIYKPGTYTLTVSIGTESDKVVTVNVIDGSDDPNANRELAEEFSVDINAMTSWDQVTESHVISFTATENGNYTFVLPAECGAYDKAHYDEYYGTSNAIGAFLDPFKEYGGDYNGGEFTVFVEAGATYEFYLGSFITQSVVIECYRERY